ncbi:MAG: hypothetical protein JW804_07285 [Sedimentisphaerales bacterium]|nr:hypothetical protein [Sedimentisphaerales bacterium]
MNIKKILFYLLAAVLGGCVPSLHPLYSDKDVIFEEKLLGQWKEGDNIWTFEKGAEPNSYDLSIMIDEEDGRFKAHLTKIEGKLFLDLFPEEAEINANDYYKMHILPAHSFLKIEAVDPNLVIRAMNPDTMKELLKNNPDILKHEFIESDYPVLTASTEQLRKFMAEHMKDEKFFGDLTNLERIVTAKSEDEKPAEPNK